MAGKAGRSGGSGKVCGGGFVDGAHGLSLARSAGRVRQMARRLPPLLALGAKGRGGAHVHGAFGRSGFRIGDERWNDLPGPSTRHRRKRGTPHPAIGRSRGGLTTKIGALVDAGGVTGVLVPGHRHDVNLVGTLMNGVACGAATRPSTPTSCARFSPKEPSKRSSRRAREPPAPMALPARHPNGVI